MFKKGRARGEISPLAQFLERVQHAPDLGASRRDRQRAAARNEARRAPPFAERAVLASAAGVD